MSDMYEWDMDRPENVVYVVGLGPGDVFYLTQEAQSALEHADAICGYKLYIDLIEPEFPCEEYYATGMTQEIDRCRWALEKARTGKRVALVCSGDAGVYGMPARCWSWPRITRMLLWRWCPGSLPPSAAERCWAHRWPTISA